MKLHDPIFIILSLCVVAIAVTALGSWLPDPLMEERRETS